MLQDSAMALLLEIKLSEQARVSPTLDQVTNNSPQIIDSY
jgi:hypothetical protein